MTADWLVVLAKAPRAGFSKTRLARDVGATAGAALAEAFVLDTLALAAGLEGVCVLVAHSPADAAAWFEARVPGARLRAQSGGDLGDRMHDAFAHAFDAGASRCVLIGTDAPQLEPATLRAAFTAVAEADVCLAPTHDGGYCLIGLRAPAPHLFAGIPWSTAGVHATTLQRAAAAGQRVVELELEHDVDGGEDLASLRRALARRPGTAPATRRALALLGGPAPDDPGSAPRE